MWYVCNTYVMCVCVSVSAASAQLRSSNDGPLRGAAVQPDLFKMAAISRSPPCHCSATQPGVADDDGAL